MAYESTTVPVSNVDCAWLAGFFEGEGTVSISSSGQRGYVQLRALLANTDRDLMDEMVRLWPTDLSTRPATERHKQTWTWVLRGARAVEFLLSIQPFVRCQRMKQRIDLAVEFQAQRVQGTHAGTPYMDRQRTFHDAMMLLNRRGPEAA